jgi:hypothetical protein
MADDEEPAPQTAPSPTTIQVPPGEWHLKVAKGNGQEATGVDLEGPLTLTISLAAPE